MWAPYGIRSRDRGTSGQTPRLEPIETSATRVTRQGGRLFPVWWKPFARKQDEEPNAGETPRSEGSTGARQAVGPGEEAQISKEDVLMLQEVDGVASRPTEAQKERRRERLLSRIAKRLARPAKPKIDEMG